MISASACNSHGHTRRLETLAFRIGITNAGPKAANSVTKTIAEAP